MHDDELDLGVDGLRRLLADQFPALTSLPVHRVRSTGTVNAIFRIGEHHCARLPRVARWADDLERERRWLPRLAPHLPLAVPEPVAPGRPTSWYPLPWAIYRWIEGRPYADELVDDESAAAADLAGFVLGLRRIRPAGGEPRAGRRPLPELDEVTRTAIWSARGIIDADAALAAWQRALRAPAWSGVPVWIHADLLRPNLLVRAGALRAVIDFGAAGIGDPAADVIAAWSVFGPTGRAAFRAILDVDDGTWDRAMGFALHQAALIIPYYAETNPAFVATATRTVEQILADEQG